MSAAAAKAAAAAAAVSVEFTTFAVNCLAAIRLKDAPPQYMQLAQSGKLDTMNVDLSTIAD
eukprot:59108-Amphidinium_carterae.5